MNRTEIEEKLRKVLRNLDSEELLFAWNDYTDRTDRFDDRIYFMSELDTFYVETDATEVLMRAFDGHDDCGTSESDAGFNPNRDYFYFNDHGNLVSCEYLKWNQYGERYCCSIIDEDSMIDYMIENKTGLCNNDLEAVFEEEEIEYDSKGDEIAYYAAI